MASDPTEPLETALQENRVLRERVAELERQLRRSSDDGSAKLGTGLAEREALLSEAERIAHVGSWMWDVVNDEVLWSDELYRILGYDREQVPASTPGFFARVHPDDLERVQAVATRGIETGVAEQVSYRVLRPDGSVRHVVMDGALLFDADGKLQRAVGTVLDVSQVRASARALERTANQLADAQRIGNMGSFEFDAVNGELDWSTQLYRVLDVDPATPPSNELFIARLHPEDRQHIAGLIEHAVTRGKVEPSRARVVRRDGSVRHVDMSADVTCGEDGQLLTIRGTVSDVTDRVDLEAKFHQSQKMEAIGQLAGGLAHDYNNLLTAILGNAELLHDEQPSDELEEIIAAARIATDLTRRLLTFSRDSPRRARVTQLEGDIQASLGLLRRALGNTCELSFEPGVGTWPVMIDAGQVQQMLLNLALNARDAMPEGGRFTITTRNHSADRPADRPADAQRSGDMVILAVHDTGVGMDEATRARAFEPFFTTKGVGRGTGLGLAMVFGTMKACGGFVEIHSQPGQSQSGGTTLELGFPRARAPVRESTPPVDTPLERSHASVLVVEDNAAVAQVTRRALESGGYQLRVADGPVQALRMWDEQPADLLVTDVEMPGMSGIELSRRLRERAPALPVLFVTGHSSEHLDLTHDPRAAVLMKPFIKHELLHALAQLQQLAAARPPIELAPE